MVEFVPPRGIDCSKEIEGAGLMARLGVDAIDVYDAAQASARMSGQSLCIQIQQHTGMETILHYTCRDRNLLSIQSDLAGRLVDRPAQYSVRDRRSAQAGKLS